jgi:hypothetical protein
MFVGLRLARFSEKKKSNVSSGSIKIKVHSKTGHESPEGE